MNNSTSLEIALAVLSIEIDDGSYTTQFAEQLKDAKANLEIMRVEQMLREHHAAKEQRKDRANTYSDAITGINQNATKKLIAGLKLSQ